MELVGLVWIKQNHLPRLYQIPLFAAGNGQFALQNPDQLPLRVDVGRAVIHGIKEDTQALDLSVLYDFQFIHDPVPHSQLLSFLLV